MTNIQLHDSIQVIENFFYLTFVNNDGAAWSILKGQRIFFLIIGIIMITFLFFIYLQNKKHPIKYPLALIIGGALGNMIDRFYRIDGVIDFLEFHFGDYVYPIFNFADCFVVVGCIVFTIMFMFRDDIIFEFKCFKNRRK